MNVSADLYEEVMNPESMFKLTAAVRVVESNKLLATTEVFNLKKPALEFEVWFILSCLKHGSHRLEMYLNLKDCLEKSLKIKFALTVLEKHSKALKVLDTICMRIQH